MWNPIPTLEVTSWIDLNILEKKSKAIRNSPSSQKTGSNVWITDLPNKQNFAWQYKLLNILLQGLRQITNICNYSFDSRDLIPTQVSKTSLSRFCDPMHDIMNSFCWWSWIFFSDWNTSLSTLKKFVELQIICLSVLY